MRRNKRKSSTKDSILDMTSFMDIIFILLIFVMISVSFSKNFNSMELDIPSAKNGSTNNQADITIDTKNSGEIFLEKEKIDLIELEKKSLSGIFKDKAVLLNIEKKVPFEIFMKLADIIKTGNAKKMNLGMTDELK